MRQIADLSKFHISGSSAVTIGKFDGLHRGHRLLISEVVRSAADGLTPIVIVLRREGEEGGLLTPDERRQKLEEAGVAIMAELPLVSPLSEMTPGAFLDFLCREAGMKRLVCGTDFRFGRGGAGDAAFLKAAAPALGFSVSVHDKQKDESGAVISSSRVRKLLEKGDMTACARLLGEDWSVFGTVEHGRQQGRTLDMPTLNIVPPAGKLMPPRGVYVSDTQISGVSYDSVSNLGVAPTAVEDGALLLETHLLDASRDLYGREVTVKLRAFLRPERTFSSLEALREQLAKDRDAARAVHASTDTP